MMDSYSFVNYFNDGSVNASILPHFGENWVANILAYQQGKINTVTVREAELPIWADGLDPAGAYNVGANANNDIYKVMYKPDIFSQEHNFSINGGADVINYYVSFNYLGQEGLLKFGDEKFNRYSASAKISFKAKDWLNVNYKELCTTNVRKNTIII